MQTYGIGEVCTLKSHRRKGLSKHLLLRVLEYVESQMVNFNSNNDYLPYTFLHCAEWVMPLYKSIGFCNIISESTSLVLNNSLTEELYEELQCNDLEDSGRHWSLSTLQSYLTQNKVNHASLIDSLCSSYNSYNCYFHGPLERSTEYFQKWIYNYCTKDTDIMVLGLNDEGTVSMYIIIGYYNNTLQIKDIGLDATLLRKGDNVTEGLHTAQKLLILLIIIGKHSLDGNNLDTKNQKVQFMIPTPIAQNLKLDKILETVDKVQNNNWMSIRLGDGITHNEHDGFVFWPVDNF